MTPPIYRARRKDNGEYVKSTALMYKFPFGDKHRDPVPCLYVCESKEKWYAPAQWVWVEIDPSTLAISFEDMIDTNGKRIFAALNESGVGGSTITSSGYPFENDGKKNYDAVVMIIYNSVQYVYRKISDEVRGASDGINEILQEGYTNFEVTGIYEGDHQ